MQEQKTQECLAIEQLQKLLKESPDRVIILDVRSLDEFAEKHIPDAINIPLAELKRRSTELSEDAIIVTACGKGGGRSAHGVELLKELGFSNASYLCGGTIGWYEKYK